MSDRTRNYYRRERSRKHLTTSRGGTFSPRSGTLSPLSGDKAYSTSPDKRESSSPGKRESSSPGKPDSSPDIETPASESESSIKMSFDDVAITVEQHDDPDLREIAKDLDTDDIDSLLIPVNVRGLDRRKINQIKRIKLTIYKTDAFSQYFYGKARNWKILYWMVSFALIIIAGSGAAVNIYYDPCASVESGKYNALLGIFISVTLSLLSFINPSVRQKENTDAGTKYETLSDDLDVDVFHTNDSLANIDLQDVIEKYSIKLADYREMLPTPPRKTIIKMMKQQFKLDIKLRRQKQQTATTVTA